MKKFYTAFLYSSETAQIHCTHKYLGALDIDDFCKAVDVIRSFRPSELPAPRATFERQEFFGTKDVPIRVLTPGLKLGFEHWDALRFGLDDFRRDEFPYNPHVTTDEGPINAPFTHYGLCYYGFVVFAWPLKGNL